LVFVLYISRSQGISETSNEHESFGTTKSHDLSVTVEDKSETSNEHESFGTTKSHDLSITVTDIIKNIYYHMHLRDINKTIYV
jgi:hypothetical protein